MAGNIKEIVNVNITRATGSVTRAGFGTMLFLDRNFFYTGRYREFGTLTGVTDSGVTTDSAIYKAAQVYFGQQIQPEKIALGRQVPTTIIMTPAAVINTGDVYTVYVGHETQDPTEFSYTALGGDTANNVVVALQTAIEADPNVNGEVDVTIPGDTLTIAPQTAVEIIVNQWSSNWSIAYTSSESVVDAVTATQVENNDWYALAAYTHLDADITALAGHIQAQEPKKIYGYSSASTDNTASGSTGIMADLAGLSYFRTFGIQDSDAGTDADISTNNEYAESAAFGNRLPTDPGSSTWMFKTLAGISEDGLTDTEGTNVRDKNGNTYDLIQGVNILRNGTMADGTFIDLVRGSDWLEARITERIYRLMVTTPKIPYTNAGVAMIENEIRAQVDEGVRIGFLVSNTLEITSPDVNDVNPNDKALRELPPIEFSVQAQGAIHKVTINGTINI